jgi:hypothetical protein
MSLPVPRLRTLVAAFVVLLVFAGVATAAAPTASTGPTTATGATTATVTGSVNPGGQATTWHVEYGTSTAYGKTTSSASAGSGTAATAVSANLTSLSDGTTYHYRVVATNSAGTSHGSDAVFTTLALPDVTTGAASSVSASAATLNGTVDPNGRPTTFYFEYGTSTSYGTKTPAKSAGSATSAQSESAAITGLAAGRSYHFRIVAQSDAGVTTGKDATFTTSSAPAVVTGDASSVAPTSATLNGTVTPNGLATTWWFEYGTSTSYGSKTSSHSAGSGASASSVSLGIKSLKAATAYHCRLVAQNTSGRTYGSDRTFTTVGAPAAQTGAAQNVGPDSALLTGSLDTHGRPTTWRFDYGTSTSYGTSTPWKGASSKAGTQSVAATLAGLAAATTYHYRLVAKSDAGTTYGADASFTTSGVTLTAFARQVVYGGRVRLSGLVPTHRANERVVVFAQPYGGGSFRAVATVLTDATGMWSYLARPQIATSYEASWDGGTSPAIAIAVHPRITLTRLASGRLVVRVIGGRTFAHRVVQLQRHRGATWSTIKRVRLGARSRAEFKVVLPKGRSQLRIALSVNQAGAGFLGGFSRTITVVTRRS